MKKTFDDIQYRFIVGKLNDICEKLNVKTESLCINPSICFECGSTVDIHQHHVIPITKGGKSTIPLCYNCHCLVHDSKLYSTEELRKIGIEKAKKQGKFKGRKIGSKVSMENFKTKPKVKDVKLLIDQNYGIREIARIANCSPNYIYKVKKAFDSTE